MKLKRKITLSALLLLAALPFGAFAEGTSQTTSGNPAPERSAGEFVDDAAITAKVKAAFVQDSAVKATEINVNTSKGTVQLSGFASSRSEIERAEYLANNIPGVKSVKNDIRLK